jgi:hypothetical protein
MPKKKLTQERLKELLHYDPETGVFTWIKPAARRTAKGAIAGHRNDDWYSQIGIEGNVYLSHRLAWLYVYGYFPENCLDHIDRNPSNNKISNLREISQQCNLRNTGNPKNNKSGVKGVYFSTISGKWIAQVKVIGSVKRLGYYISFENAVCARLAGEQCLNWEGCDSSSPAYKYVQKNIIK